MPLKNVLKPLAKSYLIPLGLTAAAPAADPSIQWLAMTKITLNEVMDDMKIV